MFIGRIKEIKLLQEVYQSKKSELVILYGRRRIGKSYLLKYCFQSKNAFFVEGLERQDIF